MDKILLLIVALVTLNMDAQELRLNEVGTNNDNSFNVEGESPDWIEIYNPTSQIIDLTGFYISDDEDLPTKWKFPPMEIEPNSFLLILANDSEALGPYLSTNFKLSKEGEALLLSNNEGQLLDYVEIPALETDISFAFLEGEWKSSVPTPNEENDKDLTALSPVKFNIESGQYRDNITLKLDQAQGANIVYYVNELSAYSNVVNSGDEIEITKTCILCAQAISDSRLPSKVLCHSYIIDAVHALPVLSLIANDSLLFDEEVGIFRTGLNAEEEWPYLGANYWGDKEVEVYFNYLNQDTVFNARCDLQMHGGRESRTNPQKTFRLKAKGKYGQEFFEYPFFQDMKELSQFKRIVIRNASGDFNAGHCRDGFTQRYLLNQGLNLDANAYQPIAVYINGRYYGLMGLREKLDEHYLFTHYSVNDVDLLENDGIAIEGDSLKFIEDFQFVLENDLSDKEIYAEVQNRFDIQNLVDYFLAQIIHNSTAWPQNNIKYWREKEEDARWRYLLFDMDIALARHSWTRSEVNSLQLKLDSLPENQFIQLVNQLLRQDQFKYYLINRHQDLYNTVLEPEKMIFALNNLIEAIEPEVERHMQLWNGLSLEEWHEGPILKMYNFIEEREAFSSEYIQDYFNLGSLYELKVRSDLEGFIFNLNSLDSLESDFDGKYFSGVPINIEVPQVLRQDFVHWEIQTNDSLIFDDNPFLQRSFNGATKVTALFREDATAKLITRLSVQDRTLRFKLNILEEGEVKVSLYNAQGSLVQKYNPIKASGSSDLFFNLTEEMSSGIYLLNVCFGEQFETAKFFYVTK